jgi:hypothetical protein
VVLSARASRENTRLGVADKMIANRNATRIFLRSLRNTPAMNRKNRNEDTSRSCKGATLTSNIKEERPPAWEAALFSIYADGAIDANVQIARYLLTST